MSDEYQLRKDVDRIYGDIYTLQGDQLDVYKKDEMDTILHRDYYDKSEVDTKIGQGGGGGGDLSNYYTKAEIDGILSSYVTIDYLNTNYALKNHTHSEYIRREEISDLDIDLTTLNLVPYSDNPNGVMCFDRVQKTIEELDIDLSMDTLSNGYLKINASLIERSS